MDTAQQAPVKVVMQYVPEANIPASERKGSVPPHIQAIMDRQNAAKSKMDAKKADPAHDEKAAAEAKAKQEIKTAAQAATVAELDAILAGAAPAVEGKPDAATAAMGEPKTDTPSVPTVSAAETELRAQLAAMQAQMANVDKYVQERIAAENESAKRLAAERAAAEQAALELTEEEEKLWATDKGVIAKIAGKAAREANAALQKRLDEAEAKLQAVEQSGQASALQSRQSAEQEFADKVMASVPELKQHLVDGQWSDAYKQAILRPVSEDVDVTFFDKLKAANARKDVEAAARIVRNALGIKSKVDAKQSTAAVPGTAPAAVSANTATAGTIAIPRQQFEAIRTEYFKGAIPKEKWNAFEALYRKQQLSPQFPNQGR